MFVKKCTDCCVFWPPYSLGKLIDWKRIESGRIRLGGSPSLLVREINWLETTPEFRPARFCFVSLLVREINWLETPRPLKSPREPRLTTPYSLGKLIDWKQIILFPIFVTCPYSLLVREINWLETWCRTPGSSESYHFLCAPYSLGKLIDWKLYVRIPLL
jgi:hypothetical protein